MNSRRFDTPLMMTAADIEEVLGINSGMVSTWRRKLHVQHAKAHGRYGGRRCYCYSSAQIVSIARRATGRAKYDIPKHWLTLSVETTAETAYKSLIAVRGYDLPAWSDISNEPLTPGDTETCAVIAGLPDAAPSHLSSLVKRVTAEWWRYTGRTCRSVMMWYRLAYAEHKNAQSQPEPDVPAEPELAIKPETQPEPEPIAARQDITSTATLERMVSELLAEVRTLREHVQSIATPAEPAPLQVADRPWWRIW